MKNRIISLILALALIASVIPAIVVSAADEATPSVEITSKNLSYEDNIRILFAVKAENIGDAEVKLNFYESDPQDSQAAATVLDAVYTPANSSEIGIAGHYVFFTPGFAAKLLSKQIFVQAEVTVNGVTYKSAVERYSVVEYCHEMIAKESTDAAKDAKYMDVIEYSAAIQSFLTDDGKYNGALATDYKYVTIKDGTLDGRYDAGIYLAGDKVYPYGKGCDGWSDGKLVVANGGEYTVSENATLTPASSKQLATETFENATSTNLPSNISFADISLGIPNFTKRKAAGYAVSTLEKQYHTFTGNSSKVLFTSNNYDSNTQTIMKITESASPVQNANMVEFEAMIAFDWSESSAATEFANIILTDANGNIAFNFIFKNVKDKSSLTINHRDSSNTLNGQIGQTLPTDAVGTAKWFKLRITYEYVSETEIYVKLYINDVALSGTATIPFNGANAISVSEISNVYVCSNCTSNKISNYVAIDDVVFRKIVK